MCSARFVSTLVVGVLASAGIAAPATAQSSRRPPLELRSFVGGYVPIGLQRDAIGETLVLGGHGAMELSERTTIVGAFALARPHDRLDPTRRRVRLGQVDAGVEYTRGRRLSAEWELKPFAGFGAGMRSYTIDNEEGADDERTRTHLAAYGALGAEFQFGRLALRAEARAYLSRFTGLETATRSSIRGDALLTVGVAYHLR
jgi:hypothetical protein